MDGLFNLLIIASATITTAAARAARRRWLFPLMIAAPPAGIFLSFFKDFSATGFTPDQTLLFAASFAPIFLMTATDNPGVKTPARPQQISGDPNRTKARTEFLLRMGSSLAACQYISQALGWAAENLAEILGASRVMFAYVYTPPCSIVHFIKNSAGPAGEDEEIQQALRDVLACQSENPHTTGTLPSENNQSKISYLPIRNHGGTLALVPLIVQGETVGAAGVLNHQEQYRYDQEDEEFLRCAAGITGLVVQNFRIAASEHRQRERAETLRQITGTLNASLDLQTVLQRILEQLEIVVTYDSASIMLLADNKLSLAAQHKFHSDVLYFPPLEVESLLHVKEVLEGRRTKIIPDTHKDPRWKIIMEAEHIRCWMGVPLTGQNQVIGVLNLDKQDPDAYTPADVEMAEAFANQAAIAIENAHLFEAVKRQAQEAETLREVTALVSSTLQQDEAIERILVQLERVLPYDSASVQLLEEGFLEVVGGRGWSEDEQVLGHRFPIPAENPQTIVVQQRRPYLLNDAPAAYPLFCNPPYHAIRSWLGVPLIVRERVIGLLSLNCCRPDYFTEGHARLISAFADQVAITIENAGLFTRERQRVKEFDALHATMADITAELELSKLLHAILERASTLLGAAGGDLGLLDADRRDIVVVSSYKMGKDYSGTRMAIGEGAMGYVAKTCQPLIINDYSQWEGRSDQYRNGPWHAVVAVPLLVGGRLEGAIGMVDTDPNRRFTLSDQRLLTLFGQQAAIAVENARLYQSAREAADRGAILHHVSQEIVSARMDAEDIYKAIHRAAGQIMPTEAFALALLDEKENEIEAVYLVDRSGRNPNLRIPLGHGLSSRVIETGESLYIEDLVADLEENRIDSFSYVHFGDEEEVRSVLAVPIRLGGKIIGALSTQSYKPRAYTSEDQHLLEMLASYAAIALENLRLFKEVQRLAIIDPLTAIYNRRHLYELGQREFTRARRAKKPLAAIILDIDHFKQVNDSFGHAAGDQALRFLAHQLQQNIREIDILGRYGGEEFVIILPDTDLTLAYYVAERLRKKVSDEIIPVDGGSVRLTLSMGIAALKEETLDFSALISNADTALLEAKKSGRNRVAAV